MYLNAGCYEEKQANDVFYQPLPTFSQRMKNPYRQVDRSLDKAVVTLDNISFGLLNKF